MTLNNENDLKSLVFTDSEDQISLIERATTKECDDRRILIDLCEQFRVKFSDLDMPAGHVCLWDSSHAAPVVIKKNKSFRI